MLNERKGENNGTIIAISCRLIGINNTNIHGAFSD